MVDRTEPVRAAVAGIVRYLSTHPDARDTVDGIRLWWLVDQGDEPTEADVLAALDELLQHDRVTRMTLPDGRQLFAGKVGAKRECEYGSKN